MSGPRGGNAAPLPRTDLWMLLSLHGELPTRARPAVHDLPALIVAAAGTGLREPWPGELGRSTASQHHDSGAAHDAHRRCGSEQHRRPAQWWGCLKTYTDTATGTKAARPQWNACLTDLRPVNTLICWEIDRPKSWADTLVPPSRPPSNSVPISGSHVRDGRSWPCAMSRSKDSSGGGSLSSPGADWWTCPV